MTALLIVVLLLLFFSESKVLEKLDLEDKRFLHDVNHVTFIALGTAYFNHVLKMPFGKAALTTFTIGLVWEGIDEIAHKNKYKSKIFDHIRGFDHKYLVRNVVGITVSFPIQKK